MKSRPENARQNQIEIDEQHSQGNPQPGQFRLSKNLREIGLVLSREAERIEQGRFVPDPSEPIGSRFVEGGIPHGDTPAEQDELRQLVDAQLKYIQNLRIRVANRSLAYFQELVDQKKREIDALEQELKDYEDIVADYAIKARRARRKRTQSSVPKQRKKGQSSEE